MRLNRTRLVATAAAATALALALTACSSNAPGASGGSSGDANTLTLAATTNEQPAMTAAIAKFKEANPGVNVNATYSALDQYQTTTRTQLSSGTAPDIVFVWPGDGNPMAMKTVAGGNFLMDLSGQAFAKNLPEAAQKVTNLDGKTYIAPITFSGIGAVYNEDAVTAAGLKTPTTWTELLQFCTDAKAAGKVAYALGGATPWNTQLINYALTPTLVYGPDPEFPDQMAAGKATFADSEWKTSFEKYLEMEKSGCFQDSPLGTNYETTLDMVGKGDALGVVQVNSAVAGIHKTSPSVNLSLQPLPATDDADATRMAGATGSSYGINAKTGKGDLAKKFIDFLETEAATNLYAETNGALPAIPNTTFKVDPSIQALADYQSENKTDPFMDQFWPNARVQQAHFDVVQAVLGGNMTVDEALQKMDAAYQQGA